MHNISKDEFEDRMNRFLDPSNCGPKVTKTSFDLGPTEQQKKDRAEAPMRQLDDLDNLLPAPLTAPVFSLGELEAARANAEIVPVDLYQSRYGRAFIELRELEDAIAGMDTNSEEYPSVMSALAEARRRFKIETERSGDDTYLKYEQIDEWRATIGKEDYNASRRKRDQANQMTPREVLVSETPEQKKERLRKRDAELKRQKRAKKQENRNRER